MEKATEIVKFEELEEKQIEQALLVHNMMTDYVQRTMKKGTDYGLIPGTNKPTLLKPGAEKLLILFQLRPQFDLVESIVNYEQNIFHYHYRCSLYRFNELVAQGDGIATSKEKRYQRTSYICPKCGKDTVFKSKYNDDYYCYQKKGGCGANNLKREDLVSQDSFDYTTVNTVAKIAQKRSLLAAVLISCGASEFFTQDLA